MFVEKDHGAKKIKSIFSICNTVVQKVFIGKYV